MNRHRLSFHDDSRWLLNLTADEAASGVEGHRRIPAGVMRVLVDVGVKYVRIEVLRLLCILVNIVECVLKDVIESGFVRFLAG